MAPEPPQSMEARSEPPLFPKSLCSRCEHAREVRSEGGSRFLLCRLAKADPLYRKYPPQPVLSCPGFTSPGSRG